MISAPELINTFASKDLVQYVFPEFLSARSDDREASMNMHQQIAETGSFSINKMSSTGTGQVQKTLSYYLLCSGIDNDIMSDAEVSIDGQKVDTRINIEG